MERMAEPYREPQPAQAAPDLASEEWPDLNGSSVNGNTGGQAGGDGMCPCIKTADSASLWIMDCSSSPAYLILLASLA